jgi:hypothetical protein
MPHSAIVRYRVEERPLQPRTIDSPFIQEKVDMETLNSFSARRRPFCLAYRKLAGTEAERTASIRPPGQGIADLFLRDRSRADTGFRERITYNVKMGDLARRLP